MKQQQAVTLRFSVLASAVSVALAGTPAGAQLCNPLAPLPGTVLRDAPLGTYLGWNITAGPGQPNYDGRPFHAGLSGARK